jgi:hypothetical protein
MMSELYLKDVVSTKNNCTKDFIYDSVLKITLTLPFEVITSSDYHQLVTKAKPKESHNQTLSKLVNESAINPFRT